MALEWLSTGSIGLFSGAGCPSPLTLHVECRTSTNTSCFMVDFTPETVSSMTVGCAKSQVTRHWQLLQARLSLSLRRQTERTMWKSTSGTLWPIFWLVFLDYGLAFYRKEDFGTVSHDFNYGDINRVYIAPEVLLGSSSNMTAAADVYRCTYIKKETQSLWCSKCCVSVHLVPIALSFSTFSQLLHDSGWDCYSLLPQCSECKRWLRRLQLSALFCLVSAFFIFFFFW